MRRLMSLRSSSRKEIDSSESQSGIVNKIQNLALKSEVRQDMESWWNSVCGEIIFIFLRILGKIHNVGRENELVP